MVNTHGFRPLGTAASLLAAAWLAACSASAAPRDAEETPPDIATVTRQDLDIRVEASGIVEAIRVVEVKSKASGEVLGIHVQTGDEVRRGTLLAEIEPRDVQNAYAQAEADLRVAQERLEVARAKLKRAAELRQANIITEEEYEAAALEEANAEAQLVKARTNLELARERLGDVTIRAPIDGTIIEKSVEVGQIIASASQNISGGTTLLKMADLSEMQVRVLVDETDIGRVQPGQTARVTVEAYPDRPFLGTVLKIEPQAVVDQNVTMFPVLVRLDNRDRLLKPGMNADVVIEIARREGVVAVPNEAVVSPRDLIAAAAAVGLDEDEARAALRGGPGENAGDEGRTRTDHGAAPGRTGGADGPAARADGPAGPGGNGAPPAGTAAAAGQPSAECARLRERIRAGGFASLSDEDRAALRACRGQFARGPGGQGGFGAGGPGGARRSDVRPGVVFVLTPEGPRPRSVLLGLNDWEHTEVVRGLEPGEKVVLISVARLQQQQQEFEQRMRQRAAGPLFQSENQNQRPRRNGGGPGPGH